MFNFNVFFSRIMGIDAIRRQSIVSLIWQIAFTFIAFFSTIYFAHTLGASVLGGYFLFVTYYSIISIFTDGGFGGAAIKRISEGEEQDAYFSAFVVLRLLFVIVIVFVLIAFRRYFVDFNEAGLFIWLPLALIVSLLFGSVSSGIAGCGKMGIHATGNFVNDVSRILIQVIMVILGYGAGGLAGGFAAGMIIGGILELRFLDLNLVRFGWRHIKSLSTFSFWSFLTSGGFMVFAHADTVVIGYYLSNADIGIYQIALRIVAMATFTTFALRSTLWPKVSHWGKIGEIKLIEESLSRAFSYSFILAVPVLVGGILLGDRLLYFLYGAEFVRGYMTLVILLIVQIVNIFQFFFNSYLSALDHIKDSFKVTMIAATANIALNLILIPLIGLEGAAVATLFTMILNAILARHLLSRIMTIFVERDVLLNILKASALMVLFVGTYRLYIPLSNIWLTLVPVVFGGVLYGISLLKFDLKIHNELKGIIIQMNLPWPDWL